MGLLLIKNRIITFRRLFNILLPINKEMLTTATLLSSILSVSPLLNAQCFNYPCKEFLILEETEAQAYIILDDLDGDGIREYAMGVPFKYPHPIQKINFKINIYLTNSCDISLFPWNILIYYSTLWKRIFSKFKAR